MEYKKKFFKFNHQPLLPDENYNNWGGFDCITRNLKGEKILFWVHRLKDLKRRTLRNSSRNTYSITMGRNKHDCFFKQKNFYTPMIGK